MNNISQNPWLVTVFGMSVVMITLAVLLFITKCVGLLVAIFEKESGGNSESNLERNLARNSERNSGGPTPPPEENSRAVQPDSHIVAVIAAAVHSVFGPRARVLDVKENAAKQGNSWIQTARWSQLQSQVKTFGRK